MTDNDHEDRVRRLARQLTITLYCADPTARGDRIPAFHVGAAGFTLRTSTGFTSRQQWDAITLSDEDALELTKLVESFYAKRGRRPTETSLFPEGPASWVVTWRQELPNRIRKALEQARDGITELRAQLAALTGEASE